MFALATIPIDAGALRRALEHPAAGGVCVFEGVVRNHNGGREVQGLHYEAYEALALREGARILDETRARFPLLAIVAAHRVGALGIGELAVWVGVAAAHRDPAFTACRHAIDEIKRRVPIWKREHYLDGAPGWLHPE